MKPFPALAVWVSVMALPSLTAADRPFPLGSAAIAHIQTHSPGAGDDTVGAAALERTGLRSAAVLTLKICGQVPRDQGNIIRAQDVKSVIVGGGFRSVATTFEYCSGGKLRIDAANSVFLDVDVGCEFGQYPGTCDDLMTNLFDYEAKAKEILARTGKSGFRYNIFLMPGNNCSWAGLAVVPSDTSDYNGMYGAQLPTLLHELGHTMGLQHSSSIPKTTDPIITEYYGGTTSSPQNLEYGDWSSQMSTSIAAPSCFNLPQQKWLTWSAPPTVDQTVLRPGTWLALTMPDAFADPRAGRRIDPNWISPHPRKYIYVSWEPALGSNRGLHPNFQDKIYVHTHTDNAANLTVMVARLSPGQRWTSGELGWPDDLVVHFHYAGGTVESKLLAAVSICRRGAGQSCNIGPRANPPTSIYDFALDDASGRFVAERGEDWQLTAGVGQWTRFYRTASPEDCGKTCFYLPNCGFFRYLLDDIYVTPMRRQENCALYSQDASRGTTVPAAGIVSGRVARNGVSRPNLPRLASLVLHLDAAKLTAADLKARLWKDHSGTGNHVTLASGVTHSSAFGGAVRFKGSADAFARRASLNLGGTPGRAWTGIVWYSRESLSSAQVLMQLNRSPANANNAMIWQTGNWREVADGKSPADQYTPRLPSARNGCWDMLAVTKSAMGIGYYRNEQQIGTFPLRRSVTWGTKDFVIGKDFRDNGNFLKGSLSVVLIYNQALTGNELKDVYRRYKPRFGAALCEP